jgi:hypothetical protein
MLFPNHNSNAILYLKKLKIMRYLFTIFAISYSILGVAKTPFEAIRNSRVAVNINPIRFYTDSTFTKPSEMNFPEGELFEIVDESRRLHDDNSQNQQFKWYRLQALNGKKGWVFGDNVAIILPESQIFAPFKPYHQQTTHFDNGFEKGMMWAASVEGFDNLYKNRPLLNPPYKEFYWMVTSERGKSVLMHCGGINDQGKKETMSVHFVNLNDSPSDEIVLELSSLQTGSSIEQRDLEIYAFQGGNLQKIFEERLTLNFDQSGGNEPSPAAYKWVELESTPQNMIRISYVDYLDCKKFALKMKTDAQVGEGAYRERCMEYVTSSYVWDTKIQSFKTFYKETRTILTGCSRLQNSVLKNAPNSDSTTVRNLSSNDKLLIIKHCEDIALVNGEKEWQHFLYVKHASGDYGYVRARDILFKNVEHGELLQQYYRTPPPSKSEWKPMNVHFVKVKKIDSTFKNASN